jgi:UDP-N-acetylglucosamine pyrophosphorylase
VPNSDNLIAVVEHLIAVYFVQNKLSFMMEAADRSEGDKRGGHAAQLKFGRFVLQEIAQFPVDKKVQVKEDGSGDEENNIFYLSRFIDTGGGHQ